MMGCVYLGILQDVILPLLRYDFLRESFEVDDGGVTLQILHALGCLSQVSQFLELLKKISLVK